MRSLFKTIYRNFRPYRVYGVNNIIEIPRHGKNVFITITGNNNSIKIENPESLSNIEITINGDNNSLLIKPKARIYGPCYFIIEQGAEVVIGAKTGLRGVTLLARNAPIIIGEDCMTSYGVIIRNHDSHNILDISSGKILNTPEKIVIGNHVWLAQNVTILKGVNVGSGSVLGFGAIATRDIEEHSIAAGTPAQVVKRGISWRK